MSRSRKIYIILALLVVAVIFSTISSFLRVQGKIRIELRALPEDAVVMIDGKIVGTGVHNIPAGQHEFVAKKEGFKTDSLQKNITEETTITLLPSPESKQALDWANMPEISAKRESLGGEKASERGQDFFAANPIAAKLPKISVSGPYSIEMRAEPSRENGMYILITNSSASGREEALSWIVSQGTPLSELDIRFEDFTNPTTGGSE